MRVAATLGEKMCEEGALRWVDDVTMSRVACFGQEGGSRAPEVAPVVDSVRV